MLKKLIIPGLIALVAILTSAVVALSWGGNNEAGTTAAPSAATSIPTTTLPTTTAPTSTHPATTPPTPVETTPAEETSTVPGAPPAIATGTDGYTTLFGIVQLDLGRAWKVVPDKVQPNDRVFVVEASCEDYVGHCRGFAVVNKVNAPANIRLTDESTAIQLAGNDLKENRCYLDGGVHDNTYYQWPYNDGTTKFGDHDLKHRIHKICGKESDAALERMHSWENGDLLFYDTDMANPGLGDDLVNLLGRARWLQFND